MEFVQNDCFLCPPEMGNESLVAMKLHPDRPRSTLHLGKSLRVKFLFRQQKKDPFSVYRLRDRQSEAFE